MRVDQLSMHGFDRGAADRIGRALRGLSSAALRRGIPSPSAGAGNAFMRSTAAMPTWRARRRWMNRRNSASIR